MKSLYNPLLGKTDITIANYLENNLERINEVSIDEVTEAVHITKGTVSKYCKKIGFSGFRELKFYYSTNYKPLEVKSDILTMYQEEISNFFSMIEEQEIYELKELILKHDKIVVFGVAQSYHVAEMLAS